MATFSPFQSKLTFSEATKDKAVPASSNNTDVIALDFKLYIEGVQVPFESISISQSYLGRPTANIQIPPESGLLDINRGYEPKVHIFYKDDNYGGHRLLFWGIIKSNSYSRSRSQGSTSITFHCEHKNSLLDQMTLDFTGWTNRSNDISNPTSETGGAATKPPAFSSISMIIKALSGMNGVSEEKERLITTNADIANAPVDKIDLDLAKLETRYNGMPGVMLNIWNQVKKDGIKNKFDNLGTTKMYGPLFEEGISFFKRVSGHPVLEERLQGSKQPYCNIDGKMVNVIIPPYCRTAMTSAVQRELAVRNIENIVGFSGELTSIGALISNIYGNSQYDLLTLASPAEIAVDPNTFVDKVNVQGVEKMAIETIVKPQIPFYYSPICNVLLPRMYSSIQVNQDEGSVPTRISASHEAMPRVDSLATSFKGPASFREAVAYNALLKGVNKVTKLDLSTTKGYAYFIPSKYEQGLGIRHDKIAIPWWLVILAANKSIGGDLSKQEVPPVKSTREYNDMIVTSAEWKTRYSFKVMQNDGTITSTFDKAKEGLNPFDPLNTSVLPHERIMFSTIDYEYSKRVASSRNGFVEAIFNPYIIPGYPMDVIDESPNHPSFHGFCTSVTHTITSRSASTSIAMVAATTYAELSNYYVAPLAPFLQSALNMTNGEIDSIKYAGTPYGDSSSVKSTSSVLIQNPVAKNTADRFYREVLGVGAAAPDDLIHFASGRAYPLKREAGILVPQQTAGAAPVGGAHVKQAREDNDYYSSVGNLRLVSRPIESKDSISYKFSYNFIDLNPLMYNSSFVNYVNPKLAQNLFLEPGASLFLDYMETEEFIKN